jgi:hypothetical protein
VFLADLATRQSIVAEVALTGTSHDLGIARRAALGALAALG